MTLQKKADDDLYDAVFNNNVEDIGILLDGDPTPDINYIDALMDETALHAASRIGNAVLVQYLINRGADAMKRNSRGDTAWNAVVNSLYVNWRSRSENSLKPYIQIYRAFLHKEMQFGNIDFTLGRLHYEKVRSLETYCVQQGNILDLQILLEYLMCLPTLRQACRQIQQELWTATKTGNSRCFREPSCIFETQNHQHKYSPELGSAEFFDESTYLGFKTYVSTKAQLAAQQPTHLEATEPFTARYQHRIAEDQSSLPESTVTVRPPSFKSDQKKDDSERTAQKVSDYFSLVMPIISVRMLGSLDEDRENITGKFKYRSDKGDDLQGFHSYLTIDEYCYPSLSKPILERRKEDQTLLRFDKADWKSRFHIDFEPASCQVIVIDQAWIWLFGETLISTSLSGDNNFEATANAESCLGKYAEIASFLAELTDRNRYDHIFDSFQQYIVMIAEKVSTYIDQEEGVESMTIQSEKGFYHEINDLREELSMIDRILTQQEEVWREFASKVCPGAWSDSQDERSTYPSILNLSILEEESQTIMKETKALTTLIARARLRIQKSRRRILQLDEDAERVERTIAIQLDLKQKHASLKEAHATAVMSTAVFGFTIITIIFTPLSFVVALFALPIDRFQNSQVPSRWTSDAGMYSTSYVGTWVATTGIVSIAATVLAMWLALEFGLKYRLTAKLLSLVKFRVSSKRLERIFYLLDSEPMLRSFRKSRDRKSKENITEV